MQRLISWLQFHCAWMPINTKAFELLLTPFDWQLGSVKLDDEPTTMLSLGPVCLIFKEQ